MKPPGSENGPKC